MTQAKEGKETAIARHDLTVLRRRGGARWMTVGFLGVAASSACLLAAGARLLDSATFGGLGWVVTFATIFGFGVATPTEQALNQRLSRGGSGAALSLGERTAVVLASLTATAVGAWAAGTHLGAEFRPLLLTALLAVVGWLLSALARGRVAGSGDLTVYAGLLLLESAVRLVFVAGAWWLGPAPLLLGLSVGLPTLISAAAAWAVIRRTRGETPDTVPPSWAARRAGSSLAAFIVVAVSYQACLNGPPVLLGLMPRQPAAGELGALVVANTWLRTPTILIGGLSVHTLTVLARQWGSSNRLRLLDVARPLYRTAVLVTVASTVASAAVAPLAFRVLYGSGTGLPLMLLASLGVSTALAIAAVMTGTTLLATDAGHQAAAAWGAGAVTTLVGTMLSDGHAGLLGGAVLAGPSVTLVASAVMLHRRLSVAGTGRQAADSQDETRTWS